MKTARFQLIGGPRNGGEVSLNVNKGGRPRTRHTGVRCDAQIGAVYDYNRDSGTFRSAFTFSVASLVSAPHSGHRPGVARRR